MIHVKNITGEQEYWVNPFNIDLIARINDSDLDEPVWCLTFSNDKRNVLIGQKDLDEILGWMDYATRNQ